MRFIFVSICILANTRSFGQIGALDHAKKWKLYNISDENAFAYRLDTLKNFAYKQLSDDTIKYFLSDISELPPNQPQTWQGAYVASFEVDSKTTKVEISHYGGLLFDEARKRHYQIAENKIDEWLSFIRKNYMQLQNPIRQYR